MSMSLSNAGSVFEHFKAVDDPAWNGRKAMHYWTLS